LRRRRRAVPFDAFLKLEGIDGETTDSKHKNEIEVLSFSWGVSNPATAGYGGGAGAGKASLSDFNFMLRTQKASPKLFLACASGKHMKEAVLTCRMAGERQLEFLKLKFTDVLISSFQQSGSEGGDSTPMESVSLSFAKLEETYTPSDSKGSTGKPVKGGWDVTQNKDL
jgi:type VI secretion system secreted protein Hcp